MNLRGQVLGTMDPNTVQLPALGAKCSVWFGSSCESLSIKWTFHIIHHILELTSQAFGCESCPEPGSPCNKWGNEINESVGISINTRLKKLKLALITYPCHKSELGGVTWTYSIPVPEVVVGCWRAYHWVVTWTDRKRQESTQLMIQMVGVHPTWRAGYCGF